MKIKLILKTRKSGQWFKEFDRSAELTGRRSQPGTPGFYLSIKMSFLLLGYFIKRVVRQRENAEPGKDEMTEGYRRCSLDPNIQLFGNRRSSILALPAPPTTNGNEKTEKSTNDEIEKIFMNKNYKKKTLAKTSVKSNDIALVQSKVETKVVPLVTKPPRPVQSKGWNSVVKKTGPKIIFTPAFQQLLNTYKTDSVTQGHPLEFSRGLNEILVSYKLTRFPFHSLLPRRASIAPIHTEKVRDVRTEFSTTEAVTSMGTVLYKRSVLSSKGSNVCS